MPVPVLERARDEMLDYRGTGMSVMEMSHRSKAFEEIVHRAEATFRRLTGLPETHRLLWLQGGASLQFTMLATCLLRTRAAYSVTGAWGVKAVEAARLVGEVALAYDGEPDYRDAPSEIYVEGVDYLHATSNETIGGVRYDPVAVAPSGVPLVADLSSDFLSEPTDLSAYALAYAGAQKNLGPAGLTVATISDETLDRIPKGVAPMLDYRVHAKNGSLYNTPPCWSLYVAGLVMEWMESLGGLPEIGRRNREKADAIYAAIDGSNGFYRGHAASAARSTMNVTFTLPDESLTKSFFAEALANGMDGLPGHRSVGGVRASIYNAFPVEGTHALAAFMTDFAARNG